MRLAHNPGRRPAAYPSPIRRRLSARLAFPPTGRSPTNASEGRLASAFFMTVSGAVMNFARGPRPSPPALICALFVPSSVSRSLEYAYSPAIPGRAGARRVSRARSWSGRLASSVPLVSGRAWPEKVAWRLAPALRGQRASKRRWCPAALIANAALPYVTSMSPTCARQRSPGQHAHHGPSAGQTSSRSACLPVWGCARRHRPWSSGRGSAHRSPPLRPSPRSR